MVIETETYKQHEITIEIDENPENPREWDNLCEFHYCSIRYLLGDQEHNHSTEELSRVEYQAKRQGDMVLPYFAYIHGDITISLSPFPCQWDSGQCGVIIIRRKKMLEEFMGAKKNWTKALRERAIKCMEGEIKTFDAYLQGEVYGFIIDDYGDSVWGYYSKEDAMGEAKSSIDYLVQQARKDYAQSIINLIRTRRLVL